ncbi:MAG: hypothetical protein AAAFM81_15170 [Pseudomonadota bacterium]
MAEQPTGGSPYATPRSDVDVAINIETMPGLQRLPYFLSNFAIGIVVFASMFVGDIILGLAMIVGFFATLYLGFVRLKNIGWSGWLTLLLIVPFVNYFVGIAALACPPGYAMTKTLDTAGIIIVGLFIGMFVIGIITGLMGV